MSYKKTVYALSVVFLAFLLAGCNAQNNGHKKNGSVQTTETEKKIDTAFSFSMTSLFKGYEAQKSSKNTTAFTAVLTGELQAVNYTTGITENIPWSAYLDEATLAVESTKTVSLTPGSYGFSLLLSNDSYQYAGEAYATIIDGNATTIPMSIKPVIGDTVVSVSVVSQLAGYEFSYSASELASLTTPQLGVSVDGGAEQLFALNKTTGLSDGYVNLSDGSHTIHLSLYDSGFQVGKSVLAQESVIVTAGVNLTMDIVALHAETAFALNIVDGNATVTANIPQEVIDEIGLANLEVVMLLSNGSTTYENNLTLYTENNLTYGTYTLDTMQFGTYSLQLSFSDTSAGSTPVGSCLMENVALDKNGSTVNCAIALQNRSLAGGNLLATVGINVYDTSFNPITGASVYANGVLIGLTGSGTFGTAGYLERFLTAGEVIFRAETNSSRGEINATLNPLDVKNFDIILDGTSNILDLFNDGSAVATYTFDIDGRDLGNVYNSTLVGASVTPSKIENGLLIDAYGEYASITTTIPNLQQYTISMFVKTDSYATDGLLLNLKANNDIGLAVYTGNSYRLYHTQSNGGGTVVESNTTFNLGETHHIVATADGSTLRLFIDGVLENNASYDGTTGISGFSDAIGGYDNNLSTFRGTIDQLRIFNRAVTQDEINQLLNEY